MKIIIAICFLPFIILNAQERNTSLNQRYIIYELDGKVHQGNVGNLFTPSSICESFDEAIKGNGYSSASQNKIILKLDTYTGDTWVLGLQWVSSDNQSPSTISAVYYWVKINNKTEKIEIVKPKSINK